jgi:hypothetical protein
MALSPKDREQIIDDETLRHEIRRNLHAQACAQRGGRGRWLWFAAFFALGYAAHALSCGACPWGRASCGMGGPGAMMPGHHCMMGEGMLPPGAEPDAAKAPGAESQPAGTKP